jgi:hypothetical protein
VIISWWVIFVLIAFISFPSFLSFPVLFAGEMGCIIFLKEYFGYVDLSKKITHAGNLPTEIASRHSLRNKRGKN